MQGLVLSSDEFNSQPFPSWQKTKAVTAHLEQLVNKVKKYFVKMYV